MKHTDVNEPYYIHTSARSGISLKGLVSRGQFQKNGFEISVSRGQFQKNGFEISVSRGLFQ